MELQQALELVDDCLFYRNSGEQFDIIKLDDLISNKWYVICE